MKFISKELAISIGVLADPENKQLIEDVSLKIQRCSTSVFRMVATWSAEQVIYCAIIMIMKLLFFNIYL
jgi:hypothetical protein